MCEMCDVRFERVVIQDREEITIYLRVQNYATNAQDVIRELSKAFNLPYGTVEKFVQGIFKVDDCFKKVFRVTISKKDIKDKEELKEQIKKVTEELEAKIRALLCILGCEKARIDISDWIWERATYDASEHKFKPVY